MPKIATCLWFEHGAEEAARLYTSLLPDSRLLSIGAIAVEFELDGVKFIGMNGASTARFTEAVSMMVSTADQRETDRLWDALTADGGEPGRCGWLRDRYGVSWQIIPEALPRLMGDPDRAKAARVVQAMLQMDKIDVATLEAAYAW